MDVGMVVRLLVPCLLVIGKGEEGLSSDRHGTLVTGTIQVYDGRENVLGVRRIGYRRRHLLSSPL